MELTFAHKDSFIHRLDPRARIVVAALLSVLLAVSDRPAALCAGLAVGSALIAMGRIRFSKLMWHLSIINGFILLLWVILPVATRGEAVAQLGRIRLTREGLQYALIITIRSNAIALVCLALLATMDLVTLGHALHHLRVPNKLVHIFLFTVRYFGILHAEYHRLARAMTVRCFRPRTNRHTYRSYGNLVGMLLVNSFDRSERVMAAMKCRGFRGEFYILSHFRLAGRDVAFAAATVAALVLIGVLQWTAMVCR